MTRERLDGLPIHALLELSRKENLDVDPELSREELIDELFEAFEEDRRERETLNNLIVSIEQSKFSHLEEVGPPPKSKTLEPSVPDAYDENHISLVLRDPTWALAVWEVRKKDQDTFSQEYSFRGYGLKVLEHPQVPGGLEAHPKSVFLIPVSQSQGTRYIHLPTSGRWYSLELHALYERESRLLGHSLAILAPPELPSNPMDRKGLSATQKRIFELSGAWVCETRRGRPDDTPSTGERPSIPQRIGAWDEQEELA